MDQLKNDPDMDEYVKFGAEGLKALKLEDLISKQLETNPIFL